MTRVEPRAVRHIACVGCGVIGGGWAAQFLAQGYSVNAYAPVAEEAAALHRLVDAAWPSLERLGLAEDASPDNLHFTTDLGEALAGADFVQESAPEDLALKHRLYADMDDLVAPDVVIGSSTSGFAMTDIQAHCRYPGRAVVAHPFNPPYLIPLVEVVGGEKTDLETVDWACAFYELAGKKVLRMERELPGFVGNRLQDAIWREALHMVANGEATVQQLDDAIAYGPGLRWAIMGPCLTFHLAGGEGGMAHMLDHFGPALKEPWTRLKAPRLTRRLRDSMVEGCEDEAGDRTIADLIRERDDCLVGILDTLRTQRNGAD
jgi:carnitine 3-dehydrogenase